MVESESSPKSAYPKGIESRRKMTARYIPLLSQPRIRTSSSGVDIWLGCPSSRMSWKFHAARNAASSTDADLESICTAKGGSLSVVGQEFPAFAKESGGS